MGFLQTLLKPLKQIATIDLILILATSLFIPISIYLEPVKGSRNSVMLLAGVTTVIFTLLLTIKREISFPKKAIIIFALFILWGLLSTLMSLALGESVIEMIRLISLLLLLISTYTIVGKKPYTLFVFLSAIGISCTPLLLRDIVDFLASGSLQSGKYFIGSFYWHNQMAGFLLFLIPLYASLGIICKKKLIKIFWLFLTALSFLFLILTYSRGAWLSFAGSVLIVSLLAFSSYKKHIKKILLALLIIGIILALTKPATFMSQLASIPQEFFQKTRTVSGTFRVTALISTLHMIEDHPLLGVGPGVFGSAFYSYQTVPWLYGRHAHNHFLQMAAEFGIVGFLLFIFFFLHLFSEIWKIKKNITIKKNPLLLGIIAGFVGSSMHAVIDFDWSITPLYALFFIFIGLFLSQTKAKRITVIIFEKWKLLYLPSILFLFLVLIISLSGKFYTDAADAALDGDYASAKENIEKSIRLNPYEATSYQLLADILTRQKNKNEAKVFYKKYIALNKLNSEPYYQLGMFAFEEKNNNEALQYFKKAVTINPYSHPKLYDAVADVYVAQKNPKEAEKILQYAIDKAFPINASYNDFSYLYTAIGFQYDLAKTYNKLAIIKKILGNDKESEIIFNRIKIILLKLSPAPKK